MISVQCAEQLAQEGDEILRPKTVRVQVTSIPEIKQPSFFIIGWSAATSTRARAIGCGESHANALMINPNLEANRQALSAVPFDAFQNPFAVESFQPPFFRSDLDLDHGLAFPPDKPG